MRKVIFLGVAVLALVVGALVQGHRSSESATREAAGKLISLALPDPSGKPQRLDQWQGKVLVINFWATWCKPCLEEMPMLIKVQKKYASNGVQIVGIALDSAAKVQEFAKTLGVDYPLVLGSLETIELTRKIGNATGGLPYTVVLNRAGNIVKTRLGGISEAELDAALKPLLG